MEEKHLFLLALFSSFFGLGLLFFIYLNSSWQEGGILESELGNTISLEGVVRNVESRGNLTFITIDREVEVLVFEELSYPIDSKLRIVGSVEEYGGKLEVLAKSIEVR